MSKYNTRRITISFCLFDQWLRFILIVILFLSTSFPVQAEIKFREVTQESGIRHSGTTYGASWGDFNGDGWPDLWVGNHNTKPSLYLNQGDGTFIDIIDTVWSGDPKRDTHGAAWADFDNDGDQDLIEVADVDFQVDPICIGCDPNHLFVNLDGQLRDKADRLGLDDSNAQARTPLWFDADRDGQLDVLIMKVWRQNQSTTTSTLFRQTASGFEQANQDFEFQDPLIGKKRRRQLMKDYLDNLLHLRFRQPRFVDVRYHHEFAQLADLSGDGRLELIAYSKPIRVYSTTTKPFTDITNAIGFPKLSEIGDVAIADFNGDTLVDFYMTRGPYRSSHVVQTGPVEIKGTILHHNERIDRRDAKAVHFRTQGKVNLQIYPTWVKLSQMFIGSGGNHPEGRSFTLSPDDPDVRGPVSKAVLNGGGISITYDPSSGVWSLSNALGSDNIDFIVRSTMPIENTLTTGFGPFKEKGIDPLLIKQGNEYVIKPLAGEAGVATACQSVVTGDFDNDMDMDLYLVCTGPVENLPNRLFENDGKANFVIVPEAGGAAGSKLGRGDVVVTADYDRDGFLDLFVTNGSDPTSPFTKEGPHQLFQNTGNSNHWLAVELEGVKSNRDGIGAKLILEAGDTVQVRGQGGGMHRFSQNHQRIHFGLGHHGIVDRLTVQWPSDIIQTLENVAVDQILKIQEPVQD